MTLSNRISFFTSLFNKLTSTNSRLDKEWYIKTIPEELKDDWTFILEILDGKHKLGYTYYKPVLIMGVLVDQNQTIREYLRPLFNLPDLRNDTIYEHIHCCPSYTDFIEPIVNRTLKLGIGRSLLKVDDYAPMLAKKWDGRAKFDDDMYITEKLDGNRCIAHFENGKWIYTSRNGKTKYNYAFDMDKLPTIYAFDGEVIDVNQDYCSTKLFNYIKHDEPAPVYANFFNAASGKMNRKGIQTGLVYRIFDVMIDAPYSERRKILNELEPLLEDNKTVKILPVLEVVSYEHQVLRNCIDSLCTQVTQCGAEGIMINFGRGMYEHKRSNSLLKYKLSNTMDMLVTDVQWGNGKYEGMVGAIHCITKREDGSIVECDVGSGLSDEQRMKWAINSNNIVGKIVEVEYFSLSQPEHDKGTLLYSLRFPRLKGIRTDKTTTSEF